MSLGRRWSRLCKVEKVPDDAAGNKSICAVAPSLPGNVIVVRAEKYKPLLSCGIQFQLYAPTIFAIEAFVVR